MAHLNQHLPQELELGPVERSNWNIEVVETDGGREVRNQRWASPLRTFEVSFPPSTRDGSVYQAVKDLFEDSAGGLHSFWFTRWTDNTTIAVRFDGPLEIEGMTGEIDHIATFALKEVRL